MPLVRAYAIKNPNIDRHNGHMVNFYGEYQRIYEVLVQKYLFIVAFMPTHVASFTVVNSVNDR